MGRVLVVDDDGRQVEIRRLLLETAGHQTWGTESASEAARLVAELHPEILLMDLRLPKVSDGLDLIRQAHAQPVPPKIIVLSGWPSDLLDHPEGTMVSKVLAKPLRTLFLLEAIQELL